MTADEPARSTRLQRGMIGFGADYYRLLFEHAGVAMVGTDAQYRIKSWNQVTSRMFGAAAGRMVGTSLLAVIPQEGREDAERALKAAIEQGVTSQFEFVHRDEKGVRRQLAVTVSTIPDRKGTGVGALACFRDITNRMQLVEQLAQSRKMASLGEMAGAMAHHFNNILGGIVTSVDFALASTDPEVQQRVLLKSAQALGRATRLVDSLLAFAEGDRRHEDVADLTETVTQLVDRMEPEIRDRGMELLFEAQPIPPIPVYRNRIDTVLLNLIDNAIQAMKGGDVLTIRLGSAGEKICLEVEDTGCGMSDDELSRIFEPFYSRPHILRGSRDRGEGLGLAVVHGIVQDAGGSISVTSRVGRGTTFTIYLPATGTVTRS